MCLTIHGLLQLVPSKGMKRCHMCLMVHSLLQLVPSQCMMRRRMCLTRHNLLQLVMTKAMMRCHGLLHKRSRHMSNECLLKKVMHEKTRTFLNGKFETRF
jgi:hypothetical protein